MSNWKLRVRSPNKMAVISDINPSSTFKELQQRIHQVCGIPAESQKILYGFPPTRLEMDDIQVINEKLRNSEAITVETLEANNNPTQKSPSRSRVRRKLNMETDSRVVDLLEFRELKDTAAENLVDAASHPLGKLDSVLKSFRKALREGRKQRTQETEALARFQSACGGQYELLTPRSSTDNSFTVVYRVGFNRGGRTIEEKHELMDETVVREVIRTIYTDQSFKNNLKPVNMAQVSPRVFWNLIRIYTKAQPQPVSFSLAFQWLLPSLDWSYLEQRSCKVRKLQSTSS